jgi:uncharacterized protein
MRKRQWGLWLVAILVGIGCANITINVYFPAEKIQEAADIIEDRVRGLDQEREAGEEASKQTSKADRSGRSILDLFCTTAYAQENVDLEIDTPAINRIVENRANRYREHIRSLLNQGVVGEGNKGYLVQKDMQSLALQEVAQARRIIREENADRKAQYEEIAKANGLETDPETIERTGRQFAIKIREKLEPGQFYQNDDGAWVQKERQE